MYSNYILGDMATLLLEIQICDKSLNAKNRKEILESNEIKTIALLVLVFIFIGLIEQKQPYFLIISDAFI